MTQLPTVAVVGRPNVGKSTLVNRFAGKRDAIVQQLPGVTRDRKTFEIEWNKRSFNLIDTGGWLATDDALAVKVSEQAERAVREASLVLFVVDVTTGITVEDEQVAQWVRKIDRPVMLIVNKIDGPARELEMWDFARLGVGEPRSMSALQGRNSGDILDEILSFLPEPEEEYIPEPSDEPRVAIVGRPNVGKSTLFNKMVGDERAVVHDMPGTTRDTIDTVVETEEGPIRFVDTAGMRKSSRIDEGTEYYSLVRALQAIDTCDVVILVIDAVEGATHQDQRLAERIEVSGKPVIIVMNKWELLNAEERLKATGEVVKRLSFVGYAPTFNISALSGKSVHKLLPAIRDALEAYTRRLPTAEVTKVIRAAQQTHPLSGVKIFYATQGGVEPPTFTLFSNREVPNHYIRYLDRRLREHFDLGPSPLKIRVRRKDAS